MPIYIFENNKTGEVREIYQNFNDEHIFNGEDGNEKGDWDRVFCIPSVLGSGTISKLDPYDEMGFTKNMAERQRWTLGDAAMVSKELSQRRSERNGGIDPVKERAANEYKKRVGKESFSKKIEDGKKALKEKFGFEYKRPKK